MNAALLNQKCALTAFVSSIELEKINLLCGHTVSAVCTVNIVWVHFFWSKNLNEGFLFQSRYFEVNRYSFDHWNTTEFKAQICEFLCLEMDWIKNANMLHEQTGGFLLHAGLFFCPTSSQGVSIHCSFSFLGQRRRTQVSWALGLWCCLHMLSGTTTALMPGSVLRQKTLRFLRPRPQDLEHWEQKNKFQKVKI